MIYYPPGLKRLLTKWCYKFVARPGHDVHKERREGDAF